MWGLSEGPICLSETFSADKTRFERVALAELAPNQN